ncbi:MAG: hypothetical protein KAS01_02870 [Candidatus Pacebacteria bacterium]|nr:hypothetical protein [Candidatus Paceibacterota bacterium]
MNKSLLLLLLIVVTVFVGGCTTDDNSVVVNFNATLHSTPCSENEDSFQTIIEKENKNLTVTGKVVEINFRSAGGDIIVFEDCFILPTYPANNFVWKLGKVHQIKMEKFLSDYQIRSVKIIEVTDK